MAGAAAEARSSSRAAAAAATQTRVRACGNRAIKMEEVDQHSPCSLRVHGSMIILRESLKIGDTRYRFEHDEEPPYSGSFDCRMEVQDHSLFLSNEDCCRDLIHRMLVDGPMTGKCDLAAENWVDFQPRDIATTIGAKVRRDTKDRGGVVPAYAFDVEMDLDVRLTYSEPEALLLVCKEAEIDAFARSRKRRREPDGDEQYCAICLVDEAAAKDKESVRLPCSHAFHSRCILPWFHRASTCPTCRRDAMGSFDFVRSASAWASFTYRDIQATMATCPSTAAEEPQPTGADGPTQEI